MKLARLALRPSMCLKQPQNFHRGHTTVPGPNPTTVESRTSRGFFNYFLQIFYKSDFRAYVFGIANHLAPGLTVSLSPDKTLSQQQGGSNWRAVPQVAGIGTRVFRAARIFLSEPFPARVWPRHVCPTGPEPPGQLLERDHLRFSPGEFPPRPRQRCPSASPRRLAYFSSYRCCL
jgi:hypothetical protein